MKMQEIKEKARQIGVKTTGKKADIVHRIQEAEGNELCFDTRDECGQMGCCWREDCLPGGH